LVKTDVGVVLRYATLDAVLVRVRSRIIRRWLWEPACRAGTRSVQVAHRNRGDAP